MGSSGFHLLGGRRDEGLVIDAAVDSLKERLGIRRLALAGQSGGARIIAQLMVIGRRDIACAAMGAGAYDVPRLRGGGTSTTNIFGDPGRRFLVPIRQAGEIPVVPGRRLFVIGDPRDQVAPFSEQKDWADRLTSLGHSVQLIEAKAKDPQFHGMTEKSLIAAGMCMAERNDADIRQAVTADE
jgi:predicted esterase